MIFFVRFSSSTAFSSWQPERMWVLHAIPCPRLKVATLPPKSPEQLLNTLKEVNPQKLTWKTVIAEIPEVVITHLSLSISRGAISARLDSSCYSLPKVVFLRLVLVDGAPSIGESSNTTSRKVANAVDSARRRSGILLCVSRKDWGLQQRYQR
jgi:hypothetical protein